MTTKEHETESMADCEHHLQNQEKQCITVSQISDKRKNI